MQNLGYQNVTRFMLLQAMDGIFGSIKNGLLQERTVELRGFGTFEVKLRKGKEKARNPKTGEIVSVPSHKVAVFRPGSDLKEQLKEQ